MSLIVSNLAVYSWYVDNRCLAEMTHRWYEATDKLNTYVRVVMLDFSNAFHLINIFDLTS